MGFNDSERNNTGFDIDPTVMQSRDEDEIRKIALEFISESIDDGIKNRNESENMVNVLYELSVNSPAFAEKRYSVDELEAMTQSEYHDLHSRVMATCKILEFEDLKDVARRVSGAVVELAPPVQFSDGSTVNRSIFDPSPERAEKIVNKVWGR